MLSEDGDTVLVFNGEIYNHLELRRELIQRGRRFQSQCDTETLLEAFLEWDTGAFPRLRGMFAAAFWSQSRQRLVLVRDRMGIKPLYVVREARRVVFRLRGQDHPEAPGAESLDRRRGSASLSFAELRSRARDPGRGDRETAARALDGMARGARFGAGVLETGVRARPSHHATGRQSRSWIGCCANPCASTCFRRSLGRVVQRRTGFLDHGPLRGRASAWSG